MDAELAAAITQELRTFAAAAGTRRALPTVCHVGHPAGEQVALPVVADPGLRTDLVERAIDGLETAGGACAWLTRGGGLETIDSDLGWWAAARQGFARHGLALPAFVVVTRTAWLDLVSDSRRTWRRVRRPGGKPSVA
jgi:hypothetical protein